MWPTERLTNGLEAIRAVIGSEAESGIADKEVKDTLWYYNIDVQQSIDWLLGVFGSTLRSKDTHDPK